jgi:hypothetical protein
MPSGSNLLACTCRRSIRLAFLNARACRLKNISCKHNVASKPGACIRPCWYFNGPIACDLEANRRLVIVTITSTTADDAGSAAELGGLLHGDEHRSWRRTALSLSTHSGDKSSAVPVEGGKSDPSAAGLAHAPMLGDRWLALGRLGRSPHESAPQPASPIGKYVFS